MELSHTFTSFFSIVGKCLNALDALQVVKLGGKLLDTLLVVFSYCTCLTMRSICHQEPKKDYTLNSKNSTTLNCP